MIRLRDLLQRGVDAGLVAPALLDPLAAEGQRAGEVATRHSPRALRLLAQGSSVSVWIGAALLAMFLVQADIAEQPALALLLGLGGLATAAWLVRQSLTLLTVQLAWVGAIGGQILVMVAAAEATNEQSALALVALTLQVATLLYIPNLALGCAAVAAGVGSLLVLLDAYGLERAGLGPLALALGAATATLWIGEARLAAGPLRRVWQPLAYVLPLAMFVPLTMLTQARAGEPWPWTLGFTALAAAVVLRAGGEARQLAGAPRWVALAALALLAALGHRAPGLAAGIMLLLLSHLRRNPGLQVTALTATGGFLFLWYYDLQTSLLTKSLAAVGNGVVLLVGAAVLRRWTGQAREAAKQTAAGRLAELRWLAAALVLALGVPAYVVAAKEQVLRDGQPVLLRLRPVDPRSLIQGDYMVLAYAIADEVERMHALPRSGAIVVRVDAERVATFARLDDGRPLAADEQRLRYRLRGPQLRLGAESFFFPEGTAERYEGAAFGEVVAAASGESVLVALRDAQRRRLGTPLH